MQQGGADPRSRKSNGLAMRPARPAFVPVMAMSVVRIRSTEAAESGVPLEC